MNRGAALRLLDRLRNAVSGTDGEPVSHNNGKAKIAYLVSQYPAPSHTFIRREIEELRAQGVDIDTFSVRPPAAGETQAAVDRAEENNTWYILPRNRSESLRQGLELLRGNVSQLQRRPLRYLQTLRSAWGHRVPGAKAALWSVFHFAEAAALADVLEARGITHLHNHFANSGANVGLLASELLHLDWSLTLHGISEFDYPAGNLLPAKIARAKFVACVTDFGRAQAMRMVDPEQWSKLFVSRCGLDLDTFTKPQEQTAIPPKQARVRIVSVGRLSAEKGFHGLLVAFAALVNDVDAELRIIGDGPLAKELADYAATLGLEKRVTFVGRMPASHIAAELSHADAFVMSSFMEGLPVVLMEALAMNVPVIAPQVAGIPELVEHGVSGLLFAAGNWNELAKRMKRLLGDPELAKALAKAGRERVLSDFDIRTAVQPMLQHLSER